MAERSSRGRGGPNHEVNDPESICQGAALRSISQFTDTQNRTSLTHLLP
jgi:hypothetical protein